MKLMTAGRTRSPPARHRREALSSPASVSRAAARRQMHQGPGAGLGAQSLLLSGDDPAQGREPDRALRGPGDAPRMAQPPRRSRRRARRRRRHRALAQAHRRARARPRLRHLAARAAAGDELRRRGLCAFRAREDAARSDRLLAHRTVLAGDHRRARRRHAARATISSPRRRSPISPSARRRPSAIPTSRSITSSAMRARRPSSSRCSPRSNSNAACCGRCSTRCITPMWRRGTFRPAPSCRRSSA